MTVVAAPSPARAVAAPPSRWASLRAVVDRGLRDQRRAPLTWGLPLAAMSALMALIWPSIEDTIGKVLREYPQALKDAFNIRELTSVEAYVDAEMLSLIVPLAVAFLAVRVVVRATAQAEEQRHLDTLLAVPVARTTLVAGAFAVAAIVTAVVLAESTLLTWVAGALSGSEPSLAVLGRGFANAWPLALFFAGVAALAAGRLHRGATVTAIAIGTLFGMYVLDLVGRLADAAEPLRYASAFRWYGSAVNDGIDPLAFAGVALAGVALAAVGAALFERRDVLA